MSHVMDPMELFLSKKISKIGPMEDAQEFFAFLAYPEWFKVQFETIFDIVALSFCKIATILGVFSYFF